MIKNLKAVSYTISPHWQKRINEEYHLIVAEHGNWDLLDDKEFNLFRTHQVEGHKKLFKRLENKGIIIDKKNLDLVKSFYRRRFSRFSTGIKNHYIIFPSENDKIMSEETSKKISRFVLQSPSPTIKVKFYGNSVFNKIEVLENLVQEIDNFNKTKKIDPKGVRIGSKNVQFEIISDFSSFDNETLEYLTNNKIYLTTFLNGNKKLHDKAGRVTDNGSYDNILNWIKKIKNEGEYEFLKPPITLISKETLDNPIRLVDEIVNLGFSVFHPELPNLTQISFEKWKQVGYEAEDYLKLWKKCLDYILSLNNEGINIRDFFTIEILKSIFNPDSFPETFCNGCSTEAAYDYLGNVYPCRNTINEIFSLGNVNKNNYKQVFTSRSSLQFVGLILSVCSYADLSPWSPYCSSCPGYNHWENSNIIPKIPHDFLWKIVSGQTEYIFAKLLSKI